MDAVVAVYEDWGIGCGGTQPIVVPEDRKHFRAVTGTGTVIVGRRTLADFPGGKPLKNRLNIVLTRSGAGVEGALTAASVEEALALANANPPAYVIGGASVYREMLPYCDRVYVTKLFCTPRSDVFFPDLDADPAWRLAEESEIKEHEGIRYVFLRYDRI